MSPKYRSGTDAIAEWIDDLKSGEPRVQWHLGDGFDAVEVGPGLVVLLGGAPGAGKTALAMQWGFDALRIDQSLRLLVANVETSPAVLLDRQLARLSGIPLNVIRDRQIVAAHGERLVKAYEILESVADRLAFLDPPFNLENLAAAADATNSRLLLLDYCQRFTSDSDNKRQEVNRLMDYLRKFADAGCGMLVLAAVGRTKDSKGRSSYSAEGLSLASFRESSELEFGCDSAYMLSPNKVGDRSLTCLKNRHGEPADVSLRFDGSVQRFESAHECHSDLEGYSGADVRHLWENGGKHANG